MSWPYSPRPQTPRILAFFFPSRLQSKSSTANITQTSIRSNNHYFILHHHPFSLPFPTTEYQVNSLSEYILYFKPPLLSLLWAHRSNHNIMAEYIGWVKAEHIAIKAILTSFCLTVRRYRWYQRATFGKTDRSRSSNELNWADHPPSRYVGKLHEINQENSTVALENVRSHGTEGRKQNPDEEIPPSDSVYEYIVFRGSDVKDLRIEEEKPKENIQPQIPNDPAILGVSSMRYMFWPFLFWAHYFKVMKYFGC